MPDTEYELIKGALADGVDTAERLERFSTAEATADDLEHYGIDDDGGEYVGLVDILDYAVLEVVTNLRESWITGEPAVDSVELLVTFGGPNIRITYTQDGWATVHAAWGSDTARENVHAPSTAFELFELAEMRTVGQ